MRYRNAVLFVVLTVVWGSAFTAIKAGLEFFPPVLFAALRYDLAGLVMLGYVAYATDYWRPRTAADWRLVAVGSVFIIAGYHALLFIGEQGTTSAAAAVIVSLNPMLTTGFARLFLPDERLTLVGTVGLVFGFGGVLVLSDPDPGDLLAAGTVPELLVFGAALSFSLGSVLAQRSESRLSVETTQAWSMLGGALVMHAVSVGIGESLAAVRWTPGGIAALAYLVGAASVLGFLIYFDLLDRLGAIEISLVSYAAPVAAAATGLVVLGEHPTPLTAAGFALILVGFVLVKRDAIRGEVTRLSRARSRGE